MMTDFSVLKGRTALVTGASKRIGKAISIALAAEGLNVLVHYNSSVREAEAIRDKLIERNVSSWAVKANLDDLSECEKLIEKSCDLAGQIDVLINNASIYPESRLLESDIEGYLENIRINTLAPFVLSRKFAKQAEKGSIVNILDSRILGYDRLHTAYDLSKKMLHEITKMLAMELAPHLSVNAVAPGLVLPPEGKDISYLEERKFMIPMQKYGEAEDVAEAVLFLLKSSFITGQVVFVDGGRHLLGVNYNK